MDINKILVIGYTSDNLLSFLSFFRELKVEKTKNEDKIVQMLDMISSFKKNTHQINSCKIQKMYYPLLQDFDKESKEKKCYIANPDLLYVAEDWAQLDQNILFILVYENPIEILKQKIYSNDRLSMEDTLNYWFEYNIFLLDFYKRNKERCILVNYQEMDILSSYLIDKYNFDNVKICKKEKADTNLDERITSFLLEILLRDKYKKINSFYIKLEDYSLNYKSFEIIPCIQNSLEEKDIAELIYIIKTNINLKNKNQNLLDFIFLMQEDIEKLYEKNNNLKNTIKDKEKLAYFYMNYGTARQRIQKQLSYRLGQTLILNSKSILGVILMPIFLISTIFSYRQERKNYNNMVKIDPTKKLPLLEEYPDYKDAVKLRNHLSYKLGVVLLESSKKPFSMFLLPYRIIQIIYGFKK
ncbi:hypothetical protein I9Q28_06865 [Campylobacter lari]|uniref:hypothetical protein n=1 Tax=Campylobacter lari TaxID=201 RepID=UPI0017C505AF|nr:hypothetical protein [Campylobacter lari]EAI8625122.1 hypothetical protein [Campylobacter lari]MBX1935185.1 hypothetical protein [Campylobacter lari]